MVAGNTNERHRVGMKGKGGRMKGPGVRDYLIRVVVTEGFFGRRFQMQGEN